MYKLLLCWRYLLTRYLALVCIVSVMLGVATLIVVNSVMSGFSTKLRIGCTACSPTRRRGRRLRRLRPTPTRRWTASAAIRSSASTIEAMTPTLEVFAMLQFELNGETDHAGRSA